MVGLQEGYSVTRYLEDKVTSVMPLAEQLLAEGKPGYVIEELCLNEMTADLKPSKYHYLKKVLEEEFPSDYSRMLDAGVLTYEIMNLIDACKDVFAAMGFTDENEDDRFLRYAVITEIHNYLN